MGVQYLAATTIAYIISAFSNWLFGRLLVFQNRAVNGWLKELLAIYAASVIGLLLNLLIMAALVDFLRVGSMPAKIAATVIVFFYNYLIRKFLIYRN